jgi:hypothetical protein
MTKNELAATFRALATQYEHEAAAIVAVDVATHRRQANLYGKASGLRHAALQLELRSEIPS